MGETRIHFKVYGANGKVADLEAVVDTGATFSKIPESIAAMLGLEAKYSCLLLYLHHPHFSFYYFYLAL